MALMEWNDSFSVGVKAMDDQHKGLVKALNDMYDAMRSGRANDVIGPLLKMLVKYTREHFAAEEALINKHLYPDRKEHALHHQKLTHEVEALVARFDRGDLSVCIPLLNFLREWLVNHIQKEDRQYGVWLNAHGVK